MTITVVDEPMYFRAEIESGEFLTVWCSHVVYDDDPLWVPVRSVLAERCHYVHTFRSDVDDDYMIGMRSAYIEYALLATCPGPSVDHVCMS